MSKILIEKFPSEHKTDLTRTDKKGTKKESLRWQILVMVREDKIEKSRPDFFFQRAFGRGPKKLALNKVVSIIFLLNLSFSLPRNRS